MRSLWDHFGLILGSLELTLVTLRAHFGVLWGHFGVTLGRFQGSWHHFSLTRTTVDYSGTTLG